MPLIGSFSRSTSLAPGESGLADETYAYTPPGHVTAFKATIYLAFPIFGTTGPVTTEFLIDGSGTGALSETHPVEEFGLVNHTIPPYDGSGSLLIIPYSFGGTVTISCRVTNNSNNIIVGPPGGVALIADFEFHDLHALKPYPPWPPSNLSLTTKATSIGPSIHDVAILSGGSYPTGTITFDLYGPSASPTTPDCSGSPIFTSTVAVNGNGSYPSAAFDATATGPGLYTWIAQYSGDQWNPSAGPTNCSDQAESVSYTLVPGIERFRRSDSSQLWFVPT